jgi:holin-like protein
MTMMSIKKWTPRGSRLVVQLLFFIGIWWVADALACYWGLKVPGTVLGLGSILVLLGSGVVPTAWVEEGARWFLAEMLLFFVPLCVEITGNLELFAREGVRLVGRSCWGR